MLAHILPSSMSQPGNVSYAHKKFKRTSSIGHQSCVSNEFRAVPVHLVSLSQSTTLGDNGGYPSSPFLSSPQLSPEKALVLNGVYEGRGAEFKCQQCGDTFSSITDTERHLPCPSASSGKTKQPQGLKATVVVSTEEITTVQTGNLLPDSTKSHNRDGTYLLAHDNHTSSSSSCTESGCVGRLIYKPKFRASYSLDETYDEGHPAVFSRIEDKGGDTVAHSHGSAIDREVPNMSVGVQFVEVSSTSSVGLSTAELVSPSVVSFGASFVNKDIKSRSPDIGQHIDKLIVQNRLIMNRDKELLARKNRRQSSVGSADGETSSNSRSRRGSASDINKQRSVWSPVSAARTRPPRTDVCPQPLQTVSNVAIQHQPATVFRSDDSGERHNILLQAKGLQTSPSPFLLTTTDTVSGILCVCPNCRTAFKSKETLQLHWERCWLHSSTPDDLVRVVSSGLEPVPLNLKKPHINEQSRGSSLGADFRFSNEQTPTPRQQLRFNKSSSPYSRQGSVEQISAPNKKRRLSSESTEAVSSIQLVQPVIIQNGIVLQKGSVSINTVQESVCSNAKNQLYGGEMKIRDSLEFGTTAEGNDNNLLTEANQPPTSLVVTLSKSGLICGGTVVESCVGEVANASTVRGHNASSERDVHQGQYIVKEAALPGLLKYAPQLQLPNLAIPGVPIPNITGVILPKLAQPLGVSEQRRVLAVSSSYPTVSIVNSQVSESRSESSSSSSVKIISIGKSKVPYVPGIPGPYSQAAISIRPLSLKPEDVNAKCLVSETTLSTSSSTQRVLSAPTEETVVTDQPSTLGKLSIAEKSSSVTNETSDSSSFPRRRPDTLALKTVTFIPKPSSLLLGQASMMSPDTPRPNKVCAQLLLNGSAYSYLGLKVSTKTRYCCIHKPQPMYVPFSPDSKISMYSNWELKPPPPDPLNLTMPERLSLYRSNTRTDRSYTIAQSNKTICGTIYCDKKLVEVFDPGKPPTDSLSSGSEGDSFGKCSGRIDGPSFKRIKIFDGGFKSTEEYTYVRGRGRGRYVCETCGIRCKKPSMLKKHIRSHTNLRPYPCHHCTSRFKTKGNLTKHLKSKAHHKRCMQLGVSPDPPGKDESDLAHEDDDDDDDDDDNDDEDEDDEEDDEYSSRERSRGRSDSREPRSSRESSVDDLLRRSLERGDFTLTTFGSGFSNLAESSAGATLLVGGAPSCLSVSSDSAYGRESPESIPCDVAPVDLSQKSSRCQQDGPMDLSVKSSVLSRPSHLALKPISKPIREQAADILSPVTDSSILLKSIYSTTEKATKTSSEVDQNAVFLMDRSSLMQAYLTEKAIQDVSIKRHQYQGIKSTLLEDSGLDSGLNSVSSFRPVAKLATTLACSVTDEVKPLKVLVNAENISNNDCATTLQNKNLNSDNFCASPSKYVTSVSSVFTTSALATMKPKAYLRGKWQNSVSLDTQAEISESNLQNSTAVLNPAVTALSVGITSCAPVLINQVSQLKQDCFSGLCSRISNSAPESVPIYREQLKMADKNFVQTGVILPQEQVDLRSKVLLFDSNVATVTPKMHLENHQGKTNLGSPVLLNSQSSDVARHVITSNRHTLGVRSENPAPVFVSSTVVHTSEHVTRVTAPSVPVISTSENLDRTILSKSNSHSMVTTVTSSIAAKVVPIVSLPFSTYKTLVSPCACSASKLNAAVASTTNVFTTANMPISIPSVSAAKSAHGVTSAAVLAAANISSVAAAAAAAANMSNASVGNVPPSLSGNTLTVVTVASTHKQPAMTPVPSAMNLTVLRSGDSKSGPSFLSPSGVHPASAVGKSSGLEDGRSRCHVCQKEFAKPSQLNIHMNIHYMERPHRCVPCSVSFRTLGHLTKHKRSASHFNKMNMNMTFGTASTANPRPFKCNYCKIAFRIHGHLAKHLRSKSHILKLECAGKLPFGVYEEVEKNGNSLANIDTTDCEHSLISLQTLARELFAGDPERLQSWLTGGGGVRTRTISNSSSDDYPLADDADSGDESSQHSSDSPANDVLKMTSSPAKDSECTVKTSTS